MNYPATRARIPDPTGTYKLDSTDRDVVGALHVLGLWSASRIGAAYGIDRAAVVRHGQRVRVRWES